VLPRPDRWHRRPTATYGGIALAIATAVSVFVARVPVFSAGVLVLAAGLAMFVVGLVDDRGGLSALTKLVSSLAAGAFLVYALGRISGSTPNPVLVLAAILWFGGLVHALNLLDNMDGLAAGVGLIAAAASAIVLRDVVSVSTLSVLLAMLGALTGFLPWNLHPARLFMGDSGSLFVGAVLAGTSLLPLFEAHVEPFGRLAIPVLLVFTVPLFDTSFVLVLRRLAGRKASTGGTDHVSHRLAALGLSERRAVGAMYLLGIFGGGLGVLLYWGVLPILPTIGLFMVSLGLVAIYLARVPAYSGEDFVFVHQNALASLLKDFAFRWHVAEILLDLVLITAVYYTSYRVRFEGEELGIFLPSFTASLPVVLGCKLGAHFVSGLYTRMWSTFGLRDAWVVLRAIGLGSVGSVLAVTYLYRFERFSRGVFVIDAALLTLAILASRVSFRVMGAAVLDRQAHARRVLIYGAGARGQMLARELLANLYLQRHPVAFLDDAPQKLGRHILGLPVCGPSGEIERLLRKYKIAEVILSSSAIAAVSESQLRSVCQKLTVQVTRLHFEIK